MHLLSEHLLKKKNKSKKVSVSSFSSNCASNNNTAKNNLYTSQKMVLATFQSMYVCIVAKYTTMYFSTGSALTIMFKKKQWCLLESSDIVCATGDSNAYTS